MNLWPAVHVYSALSFWLHVMSQHILFDVPPAVCPKLTDLQLLLKYLLLAQHCSPGPWDAGAESEKASLLFPPTYLIY